MKRVLTIALVLILAGLTASAEDLKVAVLAPLSGAVPSFGVSTRDGALLAVNEWNAKGGVLGMKIDPIVEDSQCDAAAATNAANKVINQDGVKYIIGEVCSSASIPVSEIANPAKIIEISPTSTNPNVTVDKNGKAKDYIFRACYIDPFQGGILASVLLHRLKAENAFIMYDQGNDYTIGLATAFEARFKAWAARSSARRPTPRPTPTSPRSSRRSRRPSPQVVLLPDYYNIVNLVTKQAKEKGITVPFVGGDGWDSSDLDLTASDGGYYTNHYSKDDPRPEVQNLLKAYAAAYKDDSGNGKVPGRPRGPRL